MQTLQIDASPAQMKRLHKGRRVRVKKGTGFELLVHPTTYNMVSRTFNKGKGSEIQLSPEEIAMNQGIRKAISPEAHNPSLQPKVSGQGIYDDLKRNIAHVKLGDALNEHLGTNYGYMSRAGLDNAISGAKSAALSKMGIDARYASAPYTSIPKLNGPPSRMVGGQLERGTIGRNGGMMSSYTPPALVSQPFSANFQFQHFLPPQYQHFNSGGHDLSGSGLYL
jgi:hypothetical protein